MAWSDEARAAAAEARKKSAEARKASAKAEKSGKPEDHLAAAKAHHEAEHAHNDVRDRREDMPDQGDKSAKIAESHGWKAAEHENKAEDQKFHGFKNAITKEQGEAGAKLSAHYEAKRGGSAKSEAQATKEKAIAASQKAKASGKPEDHDAARDAHGEAARAAETKTAEDHHYAMQAVHHGRGTNPEGKIPQKGDSQPKETPASENRTANLGAPRDPKLGPESLQLPAGHFEASDATKAANKASRFAREAPANSTHTKAAEAHAKAAEANHAAGYHDKAEHHEKMAAAHQKKADKIPGFGGFKNTFTKETAASSSKLSDWRKK